MKKIFKEIMEASKLVGASSVVYSKGILFVEYDFVPLETGSSSD